MRRASPGDLVVSYADKIVRHIGRVAEFAFTAPKPEEFGDTGAYWSNEGWLLPVFWTPLFPPVRPRALLAAIRPFLPSRYSPLNPVTGGGNQKAYLAAIPDTVFEILTTGTTFTRDVFGRGGSNSLNYEVVIEILEDTIQRRILHDMLLEDTTKKSVIMARRGQGAFRANVESVESECRFTGVTNSALLIASHIKPWRSCHSVQERLDGNNGLLLTPNADLLFDRGFISFEDSGEVLVSPRVDRTDLRRLGFDQLVVERFGFAEAPAIWRTGAFRAKQRFYLTYHRSDVFVS